MHKTHAVLDHLTEVLDKTYRQVRRENVSDLSGYRELVVSSRQGTSNQTMRRQINVSFSGSPVSDRDG